MLRYLAAGLLALMPVVAQAQSEQQELVDRSALAAQDLLNDQTGTQAQSVLRQARAVLICPRIFRAGFLFGGQGGGCVLLARDAAGSWSAPAFYGLGGASFGFQAGMQDAEVMLFIMNDRGLRATLDSQIKLGADAAATFIDLGGGVEGATTAALGADIVGFSRARGLYAGISLGGSVLSARSDWDYRYYGRPVGSQQIVINMEVNNPAADPLREILVRKGGRVPASAAATPLQQQGYGAGLAYGGPAGQGPVQLQPMAPVQQQALPPPGRRY